MDARASYSANIVNYCRQAITSIQHPQPQSYPKKIPEVVENLEQAAHRFRRQIDHQNRIRMYTDNLHAQCRFDTTRQVLTKMREHRKILGKKDEEIRNQNELIKGLQDQAVNQQIALDNMKMGVRAERQIRITQSHEIARLRQELTQKNQLISQQEFTIKNLYSNYQIAERQVYDLQMASQEAGGRFTRPGQAEHALHITQEAFWQEADDLNHPKNQSGILKTSSEEPGLAEDSSYRIQGVNNRQVQHIEGLMKKVEGLDIEGIDHKLEMREGNRQAGSLRLKSSDEIEASSEDPNTVADYTNGGGEVAPKSGMPKNTATAPEFEGAKVEICIMTDEDLYSAD